MKRHFNLCVPNESYSFILKEFHYGDVGSELRAKVNNRKELIRSSCFLGNEPHFHVGGSLGRAIYIEMCQKCSNLYINYRVFFVSCINPIVMFPW